MRSQNRVHRWLVRILTFASTCAHECPWTNTHELESGLERDAFKSKLKLPAPEEPLLKKDLRKQIKHVLSSLSQDEIQQQSANAQDALLKMPEYQRCRSISIFMSMPAGEVQTEGIVRHALRAGKRCFIPYIHKTTKSDNAQPASIMDMLQLRDEQDYEALTPDKWGIPSLDAGDVSRRLNCFGSTGPTEGAVTPEEDGDCGLDVVLMPAVAFDHEMNRLGHGKGYYDHFLARYFQSFSVHKPSMKRPDLIGLALPDQMLPPQYRLPVEPWDHPVDSLILGGRVIAFRPAAPGPEK